MVYLRWMIAIQGFYAAGVFDRRDVNIWEGRRDKQTNNISEKIIIISYTLQSFV